MKRKLILLLVMVMAFSGFSLYHAPYVHATAGYNESILTPTDPESWFGGSACISGNYAIVGAQNLQAYLGKVYIYKKIGAVWEPQAELTASGGLANHFGTGVSISRDYAIVGSFGKAYIFHRSGDSWNQESILEPVGTSTSAWGCNVSISGDYAVVSDMQADNFTGKAYVFHRSGTSWEQQAELAAFDAAEQDNFSNSVTISGDTAVIGAIGESSAAGAVYVFTRSGSTWSLQAKLTSGVAYDRFGCSVSVSGDDLAVGCYGTGSKSHAYIFTRSGGSWTQQAALKGIDGAFSCDNYVSISEDKVIVGHPEANGYSGAAYLFIRSGFDWNLSAAFNDSSASPNSNFGQSVSLSGNSVLIGSPKKNVGNGAAFFYTHTISGLAVSAQPDKLSYTAGEKLDLTGLSAKVHYADNISADEDVSVSRFLDYGISSSPEAGTILTAAHDNTPVSLACGALTATTNNLTVNPLSAPIIQTPSAGDGSVALAWGSITGASGYKVYTGTVPGFAPSSSVYQVSADVTCYVNGLTNGTTYYFAVRAYNEGGDGPLSAETSATPAALSGGGSGDGSHHHSSPAQSGSIGETPVPNQTDWTNPFNDIKENDWYYNGVGYVNQNHLFQGVTASQFDANGKMTRGMFVTVLGRVASMGGKTITISEHNPFSDINSGAYYADFAAWANESGLLRGTGSNLFAPNASITREQIAVILYNYAKYAGIDVTAPSAGTTVSVYLDAGQISSWAKDAMNWAVEAGILKGSGNYLYPGKTASRAEVASITERFVETVLK